MLPHVSLQATASRGVLRTFWPPRRLRDVIKRARCVHEGADMVDCGKLACWHGWLFEMFNSGMLSRRLFTCALALVCDWGLFHGHGTKVSDYVLKQPSSALSHSTRACLGLAWPGLQQGAEPHCSLRRSRGFLPGPADLLTARRLHPHGKLGSMLNRADIESGMHLATQPFLHKNSLLTTRSSTTAAAAANPSAHRL